MRSIQYLFLGTVLIATTLGSCKILEKNLQNALNNDEAQEQLEKITREVVHNAVYQAAQDSTLGPLKAQLAQVIDSLQLDVDETSKQLVDNILGSKTAELLDMQLDSIRQKLGLFLADGNQFLEEDISPFIKETVLGELQKSLQNWILTFQNALASQKTQESLSKLRENLSIQMDSFFNASSNSLAANLDRLLLPRLDTMFQELNTFSDNTEERANNILGRILLGLVGLVLLGALVYQVVWKSRYRRIIEIMTRNIDQISAQETYDELVGNVKKEIHQAQLKKPLDDLLRKQRLLGQPKWREKDERIIQLLLNQLQKQGEQAETEQEEVVKELNQAAEKEGLREHLRSILRRNK